MDTGAKIAVVALGAGAIYFFVIRRNPYTGQTAFEELVSPGALTLANQLPYKGPGNVNGEGPATAPSRGTAVIGAIGAGSAAVGSILASGSGAAVAAGSGATVAATGGGAGAAGATAGGIGLAGTLAITGGIAGGVLLTWAVWKKGLFRGGEEALLVNPDRDQFLLQFGPRWQGEGKGGPTWEESGNGKLAALLTQVTGEPNGSHYWTALAQADRIDEFTAATRDIQRVLAGVGIHIQAP